MTATQAQNSAAYAQQFFPEGHPLREQFLAAIKAEGVVLPDGAADQRSDAAKQFDTSLGGLPEGQYSLDGIFVNAPGINAIEVAPLLQQSFAAMHLPAAMSQGLGRLMLEATNNLAAYQKQVDNGAPPAKVEAAQTLWWAGERAAVARATGLSYEQAIDYAKLAINKMDRGVAQDLGRRGFFDSAKVMTNLVRQGQRLTQRKAM